MDRHSSGLVEAPSGAVAHEDYYWECCILARHHEDIGDWDRAYYWCSEAVRQEEEWFHACRSVDEIPPTSYMKLKLLFLYQ